ncbi:MAG: heavy metal sensor histidine kinase [Rhodoferax sp.]|uniref:heavy metal sensor histidine kinase n=1 Tax=Rhodoferax sp. TaxID=50421 RepID=UPI00260FC6C4|nr:heavy metal sensor histidine kinase [Rhodoferax sp.]MDD2883241.1 heavy metal sensor histidine kinase [Rhodoferax sp.]
MRRRLSLTARITLMFAAMSAVLLLGFATLFTNALERHFVELDREELDGKLQLVRNKVKRVDSPQGLSGLPEQISDAFVGHSNVLFTLFGPDGTVLLAKDAVAFPLNYLKQTGMFEWQHDTHRYRGITSMMTTGGSQSVQLSIAIAIDTATHAHFLGLLQDLLLTFVAGATLLSGLLGWVVARKGLAPLRLMKDQAASVTAGKLDLRLSADSVPVEMADLATTFNQMLERLEQAFQRLSEFSSDLAHELRTPINNVMMQTQVALSQLRGAEEYRDILASNAEEFERLARMLSDMLILAKADHDLMLPSRGEVNLSDEIKALFDFYEALAEENHIGLSCKGTATLTGDRLMIRRALSNLLSNALRHTPAGGHISFTVNETPSGIAVTVGNPGEPIAPDQLPKLFERFYRTDSARTRNDSLGTGLGLAIVKAIVAAHGGNVSVESDSQGTRFIMQFPKPHH